MNSAGGCCNRGAQRGLVTGGSDSYRMLEVDSVQKRCWPLLTFSFVKGVLAVVRLFLALLGFGGPQNPIDLVESFLRKAPLVSATSTMFDHSIQFQGGVMIRLTVCHISLCQIPSFARWKSINFNELKRSSTVYPCCCVCTYFWRYHCCLTMEGLNIVFSNPSEGTMFVCHCTKLRFQ